jgi:hypothetical protein
MDYIEIATLYKSSEAVVESLIHQLRDEEIAARRRRLDRRNEYLRNRRKQMRDNPKERKFLIGYAGMERA